MSVHVKKRELKNALHNGIKPQFEIDIKCALLFEVCQKKKVNFGVRLARWTDFLRSREMSSTVAGKCSDSLIMIYSAAAAASEMLILTLLICNSCSSFDTDNSIISIRLGASRR